MPSGMMVGFKGQELYFCEPYKPHAWPASYRETVDYAIVALGVVDTTLVVLTKGFPYLMQGSSPDAMSMVKGEIPQSCVSKRSVAILGGSVIYASPDGLFGISSTGAPVNLTEAIFTNKEWRDLFKPSSIQGYVYDDKYIGFYDTGSTSGGFIVDPKRGDFTTLDWHATAGYYDPQRDALFLVVGGQIVKFDDGLTPTTATWRSKVFYSPGAINLGFIRAECSAYPITVKVYADGALKSTVSITSSLPKRLPGGFVANTWEFEVSSSSEVYSVAFSESIEDMKNG